MRFRSHSGQEIVVQLPEPYSLPQPKKTGLVEDTSTHLGRVRAARRRVETVGQLDLLWAALSKMAEELDAKT
jgi:hypothetical protein